MLVAVPILLLSPRQTRVYQDCPLSILRKYDIFLHYQISYIHVRVLTGSTSKLFLPRSSAGQFTRVSGHCPHHYIELSHKYRSERLALSCTEVQIDTSVRVAVLSLAATRVDTLRPADVRASRVCGPHDNRLASEGVPKDI